MASNASNQIFLHTVGGRTLWVPAHVAAASETKPVYMLTFVSPQELSRSFYLYEYPIQVVEDPRIAAMNPNAKTPQDVLVAVNEFRRVCLEDQSFLLQRCYDPKKPPAQSQSVNPLLGQQSQQHPSAPAQTNAGSNSNDALLARLLSQRQDAQQQQQQQQQPMVPSSLLGNASHGSTHSNDHNINGGSGGLLDSGVNNSHEDNRHSNEAHPQPPAYTYSTPYGYNQYPSQPPQQQAGLFNPMMPTGYPPQDLHQQGYYYGGRGGRQGRGGGYDANGGLNKMNSSGMVMPPPPGYNPMMMMMIAQQQQQQQPRHGRVPFRLTEEEPIEVAVDIPEEVLSTYMNPQQPLVCGTMPGPHLTVWLREHPVPADTQNGKYVLCKGGIILMLKAQGSEVVHSKPVELFPKQVCTHFLIHGYCSREHCLHEHHSEAQLRHLIAARHVELKVMTKAERNQLVEDILEKEKIGLKKAEEEKVARMKEREARQQDYMQRKGEAQVTRQQQHLSGGVQGVLPAGTETTKNASEAKAGKQKPEIAVGAKTEANPASAAPHTSKLGGGGGRAPTNLENLGVASSGDDDDDSDSSSSSGSSSSSASASAAPSEKGGKDQNQKEEVEKVVEKEEVEKVDVKEDVEKVDEKEEVEKVDEKEEVGNVDEKKVAKPAAKKPTAKKAGAKKARKLEEKEDAPAEVEVEEEEDGGKGSDAEAESEVDEDHTHHEDEEGEGEKKASTTEKKPSPKKPAPKKRGRPAPSAAKKAGGKKTQK